MKVGVFDSGIGGKSVAEAIKKAFPDYEVIFVRDTEHFPYGQKQPDEILGFVEPILSTLVEQGCKVIVVACNTVSTTLITELRKRINVPLIAIEPMVKPAAEQTKSKIIAVCATSATLASKRYKWLKEEYAKGVRVLEPDCSDWAYMIEENAVDSKKIKHRIEEACEQGADVIVLGCTHYHWIEDLIKEIVNGRAMVIQPEDAIAKRVKTVIAAL